MAKRPVFIAKNSYPYYEIQEVVFDFYSGFAISQKQKSIKSLHEKFMEQNKGIHVLEVSTKSLELLGTKLSAFNLPLCVEGKEISVECIFQASKKFEKGGPYADILNMNSREAKKDLRLKESGKIEAFVFNGQYFENEPKDYFYNWIYIKALYEQKEYLEQVKKYSAFTDIEFNPERSLNCQAKAIAIAIGLLQAGVLEDCMADRERLLEIVYRKPNTVYEQINLFNMEVM